jgi:hypothetical protein
MSDPANKIIPSVIQTRPKFSTVLWENRHVIIAVSVGTVAVVAGVVACLIFIPGAPLAAFGAIAVGAIFGKLGLCSFIAASAGLGALSVIGASGLAALPVLVGGVIESRGLLKMMQKNKQPKNYFLKSIYGTIESKTDFHKKLFSTIEKYIKYFQSKSINDSDIITILSIAIAQDNFEDFPDLFKYNPKFQQVACHWNDCRTLRKALFDLVTIDLIEQENQKDFNTNPALKSNPLQNFLLDTFPNYNSQTSDILLLISSTVGIIPFIHKHCHNDDKLIALVFKYLSIEQEPTETTITSLIFFINYINDNHSSMFTKNPDKCRNVLKCIQLLNINIKDHQSVEILKKMIDIFMKNEKIDEREMLEPSLFQYVSSEVDPSVESLTLLSASIQYIKNNYREPFEMTPNLWRRILGGIQRTPPDPGESLPEIIDAQLKESVSSLNEWIDYLKETFESEFTKKQDKCREILHYIQRVEIKKNDLESIVKLRKMIHIFMNLEQIDETDFLYPFAFQYVSSEEDPSIESLTLLNYSIRYIPQELFEKNPNLCKLILDKIQRNPLATEVDARKIIEHHLTAQSTSST